MWSRYDVNDGGDAAVQPESVELSNVLGETLRYLASLIFSTRHSLMVKPALHGNRWELGGWLEVSKCHFERGRFCVVSCEVVSKVLKALGVDIPGGLSSPVVKLYHNGEIMALNV